MTNRTKMYYFRLHWCGTQLKIRNAIAARTFPSFCTLPMPELCCFQIKLIPNQNGNQLIGIYIYNEINMKTILFLTAHIFSHLHFMPRIIKLFIVCACDSVGARTIAKRTHSIKTKPQFCVFFNIVVQ